MTAGNEDQNVTEQVTDGIGEFFNDIGEYVEKHEMRNVAAGLGVAAVASTIFSTVYNWISPEEDRGFLGRLLSPVLKIGAFVGAAALAIPSKFGDKVVEWFDGEKDASDIVEEAADDISEKYNDLTQEIVSDAERLADYAVDQVEVARDKVQDFKQCLDALDGSPEDGINADLPTIRQSIEGCARQ